jgi:hypothetical protein
MGGEHASAPSVRLTEEGVLEPGSVESEVESADAREEGSGEHVTRRLVVGARTV